MRRDRWCPNCSQNVRPKRGRESTLLTLFFIALLGAVGVGVGPIFSSAMPESTARWLGAAIGVLVGAALAAISATIESRKGRCPICGTSYLGPAH
ncbi:MAG: hypothetical protein ACREN2_07150 [Candidatus Dormibacteria bacterium]